MLRKLAAVMLLALAASPFTAPFATCDVSTLFGDGPKMTAGWASNPILTDDCSAVSVMYGTPRRVRAPLKPASHAATLEAVDLAAPQAVVTSVDARDARVRLPDRPPTRTLRI
jgi:hypothetical protein